MAPKVLVVLHHDRRLLHLVGLLRMAIDPTVLIWGLKVKRVYFGSESFIPPQGLFRV